MNELEQLAERVEALTGPSREVDAEIMAALFIREERHIGTREGWGDENWEDCIPVKDAVWIDPATGKWVSTHAHYFTASLDAAMTLVPEGWRLATMGETVIEGNDPWGVTLLEKRFDGRAKKASGDAATPALALTAAALRARAQGTTHGE